MIDYDLLDSSSLNEYVFIIRNKFFNNINIADVLWINTLGQIDTKGCVIFGYVVDKKIETLTIRLSSNIPITIREHGVIIIDWTKLYERYEL